MDTTTLNGPADLWQYLLEAGTGRPSAHPRLRDPDPWRSWNGWNETHTVGMDAAGQSFSASLTHYASGSDSLSLGLVGSLRHGAVSGTEAEVTARTGVVFPVEVLPAVSEVLHPQWTPTAADPLPQGVPL